MTDTIKAQRALISIVEIKIEAFKLLDNSYRLNQTLTTAAVQKPERSIRDFYRSKQGKALLDKGYTSAKIAAEGAAAGFVVAVHPSVARAYWRKEDKAGNIHAEALIDALTTESLERKCALAFGDLLEQEVQPGVKAQIEAAAIAAYKETMFGYLTNAEYVNLAAECRQDHADCRLARQ